VETIPLPVPLSREILIKVHAAGYCHTDSVMPYSSFGGPLPITGSHEPAGVVVSMGKEAEELGLFNVGDRVMAVNTARGCREWLDCGRLHELTRLGQCPMCLHHDERCVYYPLNQVGHLPFYLHAAPTDRH
jgi:D-arabinose 1-dehydrogenase-like Zn-dependent alcohol dehydrogenase